jgi:hypothetical protein
MLKRSRRDSQEIGDESTNELMGKGIYRLEAKGKKRLKTKNYSFWSAVRSISILSILLWWLPTAGQMIAGYVGGRRAPSAFKSVLAAMIPVSIIYMIMYAHDNGVLTAQISAIYNLPSSMAAGLASIAPFTAPYLTFVSNYMGALIDFLNGTVALWLSGFLVTIVFAYIGGLSSEIERSQQTYHQKFSMLLPKSLRRKHHVVHAKVAPANWYDRSFMRYEDMNKLEGYYPGEEGIEHASKRGRKRKAKAPAAAAETYVDLGETPASEPMPGDPRYNKKQLSERLVARAMKHYERPKKRASKKSA